MGGDFDFDHMINVLIQFSNVYLYSEKVCIHFFKQTLTKFENGTEVRLTLEKKSQEPAKYLQKIQKKGEDKSDVFVI